MPLSRISRRADIDFMFPIAILLILIVGASSTTEGTLGKFGKTLSTTMDKFFGATPQPCPFLQKGALSQVLGMGGEIVGSTGVKFHNVTATSIPSDSCGSAFSSGGMITIRRNETSIFFEYKNATPNQITCSDMRVDWIINNGTMELFSGSSIASGNLCWNESCSTPIIADYDYDCDTSGTQYICCDKNGPCICSQGDDGTETTERTDGKFNCALRYYLATEIYGLNSKASRDAQYTQLAARPMPSYICIFIFGVMPFVVIYYLMQDLFAFVMISQTTKKMLAMVMAAMAIVTGAFADLTYVITKLTNISLGWSFLFLIFGTGLAAVVITNLMGLTSAASAMHRSLNEAHYGFMMLRSFGQQLEESAAKK